MVSSSATPPAPGPRVMFTLKSPARSAGSERHEVAVAHSSIGDIVCQGIEAELVGACDGAVDYVFGIYNAVIVRSEGSGKLLGSGFVGIPVGALPQIAAGPGRTQTLVKVQILRRMGKSQAVSNAGITAILRNACKCCLIIFKRPNYILKFCKRIFNPLQCTILPEISRRPKSLPKT